MLKKIEKFTLSTPYLLICSALAIILWTLKLETIGVPIVLVLMFAQFVLFKDAMPSVPLLFSGLFMVSQVLNDFSDIPLYLYMTPPTIIVGMVIHMIRFKTKFWQGKMLWGIVIMFIAMVLSAFNAEEVTIYYLFYSLIGLLYALVYLFYRNSLDKDHIQYLLKTMVLMGMVVAIETLIYYLRVDDVLYAIENKTIKLGWGISNYIATYLVMFIPATIYFAKNAKHNYLWVFIAIFEVAMLLFTASRGGILAFAFISIFLAIYLFKSNNWRQTLLTTATVIMAMAVIIVVNYDWFVVLISRFESVLLNDSGRMEIYAEAWHVFSEHPLFGGGLFARIDGNNVYHMYHNTFLHTLATLGLVGFAGLLWQLYVQFAVLLKHITSATVILIIALLGAYVHGMVDNIYYMPQFMILMLIIVAVVEKSNFLLVSNPPISTVPTV
ncbi:MAG: O-antigen ligase family protein [Candidatus Izemoplasmatales bacterium]|nr:O-antigen ligase family protein [Candidatus Izemoplasmatales bacterium]